MEAFAPGRSLVLPTLFLVYPVDSTSNSNLTLTIRFETTHSNASKISLTGYFTYHRSFHTLLFLQTCMCSSVCPTSAPSTCGYSFSSSAALCTYAVIQLRYWFSTFSWPWHWCQLPFPQPLLLNIWKSLF